MAVLARFIVQSVENLGSGRWVDCDPDDQGAHRIDSATIYDDEERRDAIANGEVYRRWVPGKGREIVKATPVVTSGVDDPNASFAQASPSGSFELTIDNPDAWGYFLAGETYNFEITKHQPTKARG